ncbi:MAG: OmpL47-type beta-barrel domain-containing protein, partial [Promethearchaeota archaeon]
FFVDTTSPLIMINAPISDFFGAAAPDFDVTITELNFDASWYTLNYGDIITFTGDTGTINQTKWGMEGDGPVYISFYVRDTGGLMGHAEVTVYKDTTAPSSSIYFVPYQLPNIVNKSTTFRLDADDGTGSGVSVIRYKINDSSWSDYSVSFDLSSYEPGHYLISYYSVDNIGNIELENSIEVILLKKPSKPPAIHGFEIFLIISLICIVSIIAYKRRYKSINY